MTDPFFLAPEEEIAQLRAMCPPGRRPLDHLRALAADCLAKRDSVARNIALRMAAEQHAARFRRALKSIARELGRQRPGFVGRAMDEASRALAPRDTLPAMLKWYDGQDHSELVIEPFRLEVARASGGWWWQAKVASCCFGRDVSSGFVTAEAAKQAAVQALAGVLRHSLAALEAPAL